MSIHRFYKIQVSKKHGLVRFVNKYKKINLKNLQMKNLKNIKKIPKVMIIQINILHPKLN